MPKGVHLNVTQSLDLKHMNRHLLEMSLGAFFLVEHVETQTSVLSFAWKKYKLLCLSVEWVGGLLSVVFFKCFP